MKLLGGGLGETTLNNKLGTTIPNSAPPPDVRETIATENKFKLINQLPKPIAVDLEEINVIC